MAFSIVNDIFYFGHKSSPVFQNVVAIQFYI